MAHNLYQTIEVIQNIICLKQAQSYLQMKEERPQGMLIRVSSCHFAIISHLLNVAVLNYSKTAAMVLTVTHFISVHVGIV